MFNLFEFIAADRISNISCSVRSIRTSFQKVDAYYTHFSNYQVVITRNNEEKAIELQVKSKELQLSTLA